MRAQQILSLRHLRQTCKWLTVAFSRPSARCYSNCYIAQSSGGLANQPRESVSITWYGDMITYSSLLRFVFICGTVSHIITDTGSEAVSLFAGTRLQNYEPCSVTTMCCFGGFRNICLENTLIDTAPSEVTLKFVWLSVPTSFGMWLR